jgi:hypothetical protein
LRHPPCDRRRRSGAPGASLALALPAALLTARLSTAPAAENQPSDPGIPLQSLDEAWWTGPLLAASASTLPQGHFLIEPYVYDSVTYERFDRNGARADAPREETFGSLTYVLYGLTDLVSVGLLPRFGYNQAPGGTGSSGIGSGDLAVQGQYRLTQFSEEHRVPTVSVVLMESLPTGKYDHLDAEPGDGLGSGAYTTTVALYSQDYFWMPNGRILRTRLNVSYSLPSHATLQGLSAYGTPAGFRGQATPGRTAVVDAAFEYSLTRRWVIATDLWYEHDASTEVKGIETLSLPAALESVTYYSASGASDYLALAPALEFNWSRRMGLIIGAKVTVAGRNVPATVLPAAAVNMVF